MPVKRIEKEHVLQHATSIIRQRNIVMQHLLKQLDTIFFMTGARIHHIYLNFFSLIKCGLQCLYNVHGKLTLYFETESVEVGKHTVVSQFLKTTSDIKPSLTKYICTWDAGAVVTDLKDISSNHMCNLSKSLETLTEILNG